ncbi:sulfotransferase [Halioxenophilus sp. WMMB6]|uniref:sulfotransferase family protein n=1 Tax=Halioxenophilus sp. WMMB6 TaxID=3073815 RepID=UPI00295EFD64|nr:sulfotransferase [Halioxenophilus sp. WMMB6]
MTWTPPKRSEWVAYINQLGSSHVDSGKAFQPLNADQMLEDSCKATGLNDYGDEWFLQPYRVLVNAMNEEAELNTIGRFVARSEILRTLQYRLLVEELFAKHPEISDQEVSPVHVVTGLGRTGTSILHELLTVDTNNRVPIQWEMMYPVPAPEAATFATDERINKADLEIRYMEQVIPAIRTMHENGGNLPNECIFLFALTFASELFSGRFNLPSYDMWMAMNDLTPAYAYHKRMLQLLQWKHPKKRWILKAPTHLNRLPYLFAAYPNAKVAITHRDPLKVMASVTNLLSSLKYMHSDVINYEDDLARIAFGNAYLCQHMIDERKAGNLPADQIVDVRYSDLMSDPVDAVKNLYRQWDIPFSDELGHRITAYLEAKPREKHGAHNYSFADTGLNLEEERAKYAEYQAHFGVPSEV